MLGMSTNPGPFVFASFGLFMLAFQREFGWGRGDLSLALTGLTISCAVALPIVGRMIDRVGARRIQLVSMAIQAVLLALIPLVVSKIWHLTVLLIALGALTASANGVAYMHVISAWFYRKRGLAIGLVMAGTGLGYTYVPVLVRYVIDDPAGLRDARSQRVRQSTPSRCSTAPATARLSSAGSNRAALRTRSPVRTDPRCAV